MVKTQNVDTETLNQYIDKSGMKIGSLADALGISRQAFDQKRKGAIAFRASEVYVVCDLCRIPEDVRPKIFCL